MFITKKDYYGFKLISLDIKQDKIFGDIFYDFVDDGDSQNEIYTTVVIGTNGTRKSLLLKRIIELFLDLQSLKQDSKKNIRYGFTFSLKYSIDNLLLEYTNIEKVKEGLDVYKEIHYKINNNIQFDYENNGYSFSNVIIPDSIIAISTLITDKFPFPNTDLFPQYKYLGPRYRPQLASNTTFISRAVELIANSTENLTFLALIHEIIEEFFENEHSPYIVYFTQNAPFFFSGKLTVETFISYYDDINTKYLEKTTTPPFKLNYFKSKIANDKELIEKLINYCNKLKKEKRLRGFPRSSSKAIDFKVDKMEDLILLHEESKLLNHLRSLGIIHSPALEFLKKSEFAHLGELRGYSVLESSSGEYNIFGTMIGLAASIKPNSLILIDEPEISLHPNWQMKYLNFIRKMLVNPIYGKCHLLIATHSHFIISDLKGENSKIIGLKNKNGKIENILLPKGIDTYGWSTDDVLYKVFEVRTTRNYYMEVDLRELLHSISENKKNKTELQNIISRLEKVKLNEEDPLIKIIDKAKDYITKL